MQAHSHSHAEALLTDDVLSLEGVQHLHLTGIVLGISPATRVAALTLLDAALNAGLSVSFDPNIRPNLWQHVDEMRSMINTVASRATVVMPGLAEGQLLTGMNEPDEIAQFYLRRGVPEVALKLGAAGARGWTADGESDSIPSVRRQHRSTP